MIEVEHLTKRYGTHTAVSDLSFRVDGGQVYGFLGPNGAGKSTTLNIITGCLSATEGQVRIDGFDILEEPKQAKRRIGYLPEQPPLYMNETPEEYLRFVGEAKGLRGAELARQVDAVIQQTGIGQVQHRRIAALSKGYRQRVGIAQALLGSPGVIILDEPTVGLDPLQLIEVRDLIKALGQTHTVIFSSHILSEVQAICDQILILSKGRLVAFDTAENLEKLLLHELSIVTDAAEADVREILADIRQIAEFQTQTEASGLVSARLKTGGEDAYALSRAVFAAFAARGAVLLEMAVKKANLEEIFLELTDSGGPEAGGAADAATAAGGAVGVGGGGAVGDDVVVDAAVGGADAAAADAAVGGGGGSAVGGGGAVGADVGGAADAAVGGDGMPGGGAGLGKESGAAE